MKSSILTMLAVLLFPSLHASTCSELFMDPQNNIAMGLEMLNTGENTKAAQFFKDRLANEEKACKREDKIGPYEILYVAVADYRGGNFVEAKEYLLKMFAVRDKFYSYDYTNVGYACLIATKTNDVELFKTGLSFVNPKFSWGEKENKEFAKSCLNNAINHMKLDGPTKQMAAEKLAIISELSK